jgi:drug/metabolite transporter (DMT)-like permease
MRNLVRNPYLLLTLTALFWSGNMVVGRGIRGDMPPFALAFWRWVIAFACIVPFALPHLRNQARLLLAGWRPLLLLGLLGVGGYNTLAYIALQYTDATNAVLLNSFIPVVTMAIAWAFLGYRLNGMQGTGVLISLVGAMTIVARGDPAVLGHLDLNRGDLWMLVAVLTWALYTAGLQWRPAGLHPMLLLATLTLVGLLALAPFYAWESMVEGRLPQLSGHALLGVAYVGILPSFVGYVFYNRGVAQVGPARASLFIHLMPVFGTLLSALILDEVPHLYHGIGIVLIFAGIWLTNRRPLREAA